MQRGEPPKKWFGFARATIRVAPATPPLHVQFVTLHKQTTCTCNQPFTLHLQPRFVLVNLQSEQMIHSVNKQHIGRKPRPRINIMQRCSIVAYLKCGISVSSICQETGTSRATVFRIMKSWKSGAIPNAQTKQLGRPKKTTTEQDAFIVDAVENNRKMVPRLVQRMLLEI